MAGIILILIVAGIAVYVWSTYNQFVKIKTRIQASIQEIGNQLKRQADLIPNLESAAKAYLKQEKGIFKALTDARKAVSTAAESGNLQDVDAASELLGKALNGLNILVESNPEIKSNQVISKLMNELRDTADKVMYSRRTLIDLAADYNIMIATFPSNMVAKLFKFTKEDGLDMPENSADATSVSSEELKTPQINFDQGGE